MTEELLDKSIEEIWKVLGLPENPVLAIKKYDSTYSVIYWNLVECEQNSIIGLA